MLFSSYVFPAFILVFFLLWPLFRGHATARWAFISAFSLIFLAWCDPRLAFLALACGCVTYVCGRAITARPALGGLLLALSLVVNLGMFAAYRFHWLAPILGAFGISDAPIPLAAPFGILFFLLQSAAYSIDLRRGRIAPARNLLHFLAFQLLFPAALTGPIARPGRLLPQLLNVPRVDEAARWRGARFMILGWFLAGAVAANLSVSVADAFNAVQPADSWSFWWGVSASIGFQAYAVYHGYSLIGRGLAAWMGLDLPRNFNHPFAAASFASFWSRWNRSLVAWVRVYLEAPLGIRLGHRARPWVFPVLLPVVGLAYGSGWNFALWGLLHALALGFERISRWPVRLARLPGGRLAATGMVFLMVTALWVVFRVQDLGKAGSILACMFGFSGDRPHNGWFWATFKSLPFLAMVAAYEAKALAPRGIFGSGSALARLRFPGLKALEPALEPVFWAVLLAMAIYLRGPGADLSVLTHSLLN